MSKLDEFKQRSLDWALQADKDKGKKKTEEDKINEIDDDHTPIWIMTAFTDEKVFGFQNVMANIFYAKKTNSYTFNYRFMYGDGRKNWYHFKHKGLNWTPAKHFHLDKAKESMKEVMAMLSKLGGGDIKIKEMEFDGDETPTEVIKIMQNSGLVNTAKVDTKKKTVEVNPDFDELDL